MAKKLKPMVRLTKNQLQDKLDFILNYRDKNLNPASASTVDPNANITSKNIATLQGELYKDFNIQIKRMAVKQKLIEKYGDEFADEYEKMIEDHLIYIHDETSTLGTPYCCAITLYPLLEYGLLKFGGASHPPKHLESFCGSFINLIYACTSCVAGAVATAEFLLYFHYFAVKDFGPDYLKTHEDVIKNKLENVVYCINTPSSARSFQSCFWNISVFDRYFFNQMFGHFNFPDGTHVSYDEFNPLQKYFLEWFLKERHRALLTFPVITEASLNEDDHAKDAEWADFIADIRSRGLSFFSYNDSDVNAISSCCVTGDSIVTMYNKDGQKFETRIDDIDQFKKYAPGEYTEHTYLYVDSFNPETETFERQEIMGYLKQEYTGPIYTIHCNDTILNCTPDHLLTIRNKETEEISTVSVESLAASVTWYPYHLYSVSCQLPIKTDEGVEYVDITDITRTQCFSSMVYDIMVPGNEHFIVNGLVSHNCRLKNDIDKDDFQYSLGGASAVITGSVQVITINLLRLFAKKMDLEDVIKKVHKIHAVYREIIQETIDAGLLPIYDSGFLVLSKQFNTVGLSGLNEAAEYLGYTVSNNKEYIDWVVSVVQTFARLNKEAKAEFGIKFNTEFVPGESLGIKNCNWDKKDGLYSGNRNCYNSYVYLPEDDQISIPDKFMLHGGEIAENLDGGSALHLNISQLPDKELFLWLRNLAAKYNCKYWTTNILSTCCNECCWIDFRTLEKCPMCGSSDISFATRIIGYLKKIKHYSEGRQIEAEKRFYH